MKAILIAAAAAASAFTLAAVPAAAQTAADPSFYGTLGYTFVDADGGDLGAITGRVGVRAYRYFGAEGELSLGVDSDKANFGGVEVKTKLKHQVAAYAVGYLPVTPQLDLFVRGGYGASRLRVSSPLGSDSDTEDSWNYGVGAQYVFDGVNGVRADYTAHDFGNGYGTADTWSVAYVRKF